MDGKFKIHTLQDGKCTVIGSFSIPGNQSFLFDTVSSINEVFRVADNHALGFSSGYIMCTESQKAKLREERRNCTRAWGKRSKHIEVGGREGPGKETTLPLLIRPSPPLLVCCTPTTRVQRFFRLLGNRK